MCFSKLRIYLSGLLIGGFFLSAFPQNGSNPLLQKAEEAFNTQKWKSAGTLYELLLKDTIRYSPYMAKALLANELAADSVSLVRERELFERNDARLDSLLNDFSRLCIRLRYFDSYEDALGRMRQLMPEKSDSLLYGMIKYRLFLREPKRVIKLAQMGRNEQPENIVWLKLEAEGWSLLGDANHALPVYRQILERNPYDLDALLFLGNYYYLNGKQKLKHAEEAYVNQTNDRMQYAAYRAQLQLILDEELARSSELLEKANEINPNSTVANTLYDIYVLKSDVDKANKLKKNLRR